ncbi:MAG: hypothetical protein JWR26_631 [Pedosphaera sp.]|nr:hypothetical protein [Pedosphaera sp.]
MKTNFNFSGSEPRSVGAKSTRLGPRSSAWSMWFPLIALLLPALVWKDTVTPRASMWLLSLAIFFGCKWLTWRQQKLPGTFSRRDAAYLFGWPGLDAKSFLDPNSKVCKPRLISWISALVNTLFGAALLWGLARTVPASQPILRGWIGLFGLIFVLHFGTFHLLALAWQRLGINARPLMQTPIVATSLADFWGRRWNSAFNRLAHDVLARPLYRRIGITRTTLIVFLVSGIIHDIVISVPASAGYGLPTLYFLLQGVGVLFERSKAGQGMGLRKGTGGWLFTLIVAAGPAFWLFHTAFIMRVIIPFMQTIHAI